MENNHSTVEDFCERNKKEIIKCYNLKRASSFVWEHGKGKTDFYQEGFTCSKNESEIYEEKKS